MGKDLTIQVKEIQELVEIFGTLDAKTKELALATLTGMRLVSENKFKDVDSEEIA